MLTEKQKRFIKGVAIGAGVVAVVYLTGSSCYRLGKVCGAGAMGDLVVDRLKIPMKDMPSVFEAAGVKL